MGPQGRYTCGITSHSASEIPGPGPITFARPSRGGRLCGLPPGASVTRLVWVWGGGGGGLQLLTGERGMPIPPAHNCSLLPLRRPLTGQRSQASRTQTVKSGVRGGGGGLSSAGPNATAMHGPSVDQRGARDPTVRSAGPDRACHTGVSTAPRARPNARSVVRSPSAGVRGRVLPPPGPFFGPPSPVDLWNPNKNTL